ncbi:MAG: hypothetical protein IKW03_10135 [Clostridia bacterium]|nr:hypothetical protein [Clostridia bacterium]
MKKSICAVLAILLCMTVFFAGCADNTTPGGVVDNSNAADAPVVNNSNAQSDIKIEEGESTVQNNLGTGVDLFIGGKYYLEGTIYSEGEAMPVAMATDGTNVQLTANISGISFGVLVLGDKTYAVLPKANTYTELSQMLINALGIEDSINVSEFQDIRNDQGDTDADITQYSVSINGDPGLCTIYTYDDTIVKLYSIGDKLIQVENYDLSGAMTMQIVVDSITSQIPSNQLTLKGIEEASVTSFIKAFMASISA